MTKSQNLLEWGKAREADLLRWGLRHTHLPQVSDWHLGSTSGVIGSVTPFDEGPTISAGTLTLPMARLDAKNNVAEQIKLTGYGVGLSVSVAAEIPVNISFSTARTPGSGSRAVVGPLAPIPTPASYFEGICIICSADLIYGFLDKSSSAALFLPYVALTLPYPFNLSLTKAVGLIEGLSFTTTAAGYSAGVQAFVVSLNDAKKRS